LAEQVKDEECAPKHVDSTPDRKAMYIREARAAANQFMQDFEGKWCEEGNLKAEMR
jgi:hypothetical protein